jgi:hypothetical protein
MYRAPTQDSWLNYKSTLIFGKIWAYGPSHATPSVSYDLPSSAPVIAASKYTLPKEIPLIDECINHTRAMGVLQRYAKNQESESDSTGKGRAGIKVLQMCGTADILHRQAMRLDEVLRSFGKEVVRPELIVVSNHLHRSLSIFLWGHRARCLISLTLNLIVWTVTLGTPIGTGPVPRLPPDSTDARGAEGDHENQGVVARGRLIAKHLFCATRKNKKQKRFHRCTNFCQILYSVRGMRGCIQVYHRHSSFLSCSPSLVPRFL